MKIMNGNLGKPWQLIHFVSSRLDHFFHSELLFGLHEFPVDADGHIGIDAAKENLRGVDRVVPVKFENNLEFRLRWSIIEGRQEGSSLLFVVRNNVLVHDRHSGMIKQPRRPRRDRDPNGAVGADISKSLATRAAAAQGRDLPWRLLSSYRRARAHPHRPNDPLQRWPCAHLT